MTDAEIIKALENHLSDEGECSECAYFENIGSCVGIMHKDLYDLINRQKAEGENQSENFKVLVSDHRTLQQSFDNLKGLYEAEKAKVEKAKEKCIKLAKELQTAKAELKETTENFNRQQTVYVDLSDIIREKNAEIERLKNNVFCKVEIDEETMRNIIKEKVAEFELDIKSIKAEAIKYVLLQLEAEAESSDKYIREYDDSEIQKAYNKGLWTAYNLVKEMVGDTE